jgi:hypothetical protein
MEKYLKRLELEKKKLQRTKLAGYDIKLSLLDDIQDYLSNASFSLEQAEEKFDEAVSARTLVADIIRFDLRQNTITAEDELRRLIEGIEDLGIDVPSEVSQLQSTLDDLLKEEDDIIRRLNDVLGFKIN